MNTLQTAPRNFDTLHTLNVWTPYGSMMRKLFEVYHREGYIFRNTQLWTGGLNSATAWTEGEIVTSLVRGTPIDRCLNLWPGTNCVSLKSATVVSATPVEGYEDSWILVVKGFLTRQECSLPATIVAYYGEYGRGFCLVPEREMQQLWAGDR